MRHVAMLPSLLTLGNFTSGLLSVVLTGGSLYFLARAEQGGAVAARIEAAIPEGLSADRREAGAVETPPAAGSGTPATGAVPAAPAVSGDASAEGAGVVVPPSVSAVAVAPGAGADMPAIVKDLRHRSGKDRERSLDLFLYAGLMVFVGMFFDMLDGRVARMTHSESRFGAELDSLADVCSFGIAPAVMVAALWQAAHPPQTSWYGQVLLFAAVYAACAVLRLARYNVEIGTGDKNHFKGLPSPAAAGCVVSVALFAHVGGYLDPLWALFTRIYIHWSGRPMSAPEMMSRIIALYALGVGILMVTRLTFVHVMNKYMTGRKKFHVLVLAVFLLMLLVNFPYIMLFAAFNGYVAVSVAVTLWRDRRSLVGRMRQWVGLRRPAAAGEIAMEAATAPTVEPRESPEPPEAAVEAGASGKIPETGETAPENKE